MKYILLFLLGFICLARAQEPYISPVDPNDVHHVIARVIATYKSMESYSSNGSIVTDQMTGGFHVVTTTTFAIKLKKPNLYLITWSQTSIPAALPQGGAVWNEGTQPYLYLVMDNSYSKIGSDVAALGAANSISAGVTDTIPSLFLPAFTDKGAAVSRLLDPVIEKTDFANGEECYVISGQTNLSKKETFWISKASNLVLKFEKDLEAPVGGATVTYLSDDDLEKALKALGQPVTEETKRQTRELLKTAGSTIKNGDVTGTSVEDAGTYLHDRFDGQRLAVHPAQGRPGLRFPHGIPDGSHKAGSATCAARDEIAPPPSPGRAIWEELQKKDNSLLHSADFLGQTQSSIYLP